MTRKLIRRIATDREHDLVLHQIKELEKQRGNEKEIERLKGLVFDYELGYPTPFFDPDVDM